MKEQSSALSNEIARSVATVSGQDPAFTDASLALTFGSRFRSAQFSDQALKELPHLAAAPMEKDARLDVMVHGLAWNARYGCDELLFWVTLPGAPDAVSGHYFARALTALSPHPVTRSQDAVALRSDWFENPLRAIRAAAIAQGRPCDYALALSVLRDSADWDDITPESYLDDVLTEIAGKTHIVCEYGNAADNVQRGRFRAYYDFRPVGPAGTTPPAAGEAVGQGRRMI
ncbi:MAG: hypothetical protein EPN77_19350 [Candidimonas sp.]|nr:MAG: hypothetical protein EPN77_19350 [Candidimonas sp.]